MSSDATSRRSARRTGLASTAVIVALALGVVSLLSPATFAGPVATFVLSYLPALIVLTGTWAHHPERLTSRSQPARGAILLVAALLVGTVAELVFVATVGAGRGAGTPQIAMFSIVVVVTTFWLGVVLEGWPFAKISHGVLAPAAMLVTAYAVALVVYYALFDLTFLPPPVQAPGTPAGAFNAWYVLSFLVTAISAMFVPPAFGLLGLERLRQPLRGLAWSALCLAWAGLLFGAGVGALGVDPVAFMVWVPVALMFGGVVLLVVLRDSLFGGYRNRSLRGVSNVSGMAALGVFLVWVYRLVAGLAWPAIAWGAPTYQGEVWVASATLAFTFPLLATHADFFGQWPLGARGTAPAVVGDEEAQPVA